MVRAWIAVGLLVAVAACSTAPGPPQSSTGAPPSSSAALQPSEPFGLTTVTLRSPDGEESVAVRVYDAYEPHARRRGLMGRTELPDGTGMVFRFRDDRERGFWMRDTLIPLSIAYFDAAGEVVAVLDMAPCPQDPCPSYDTDVAYRGALEVNQGYFDTIGLEPGWRVEVPEGLPPPR